MINIDQIDVGRDIAYLHFGWLLATSKEVTERSLAPDEGLNQKLCGVPSIYRAGP